MVNPAEFLSTPGLASQVALKRTEEKLRLLINIDMLLTVKKENAGGIRHAILRYANADNKYIKDYDKNKECHVLHIGNK